MKPKCQQHDSPMTKKKQRGASIREARDLTNVRC